MIRELPPDLEKIATNEINERPGQTASDILHLKEWISKQPHLKARTDDQWLVAMLRGCKFSLEKVKKKIDSYYTLRKIAPDIISKVKPIDKEFLDFFKLGTCVVLPKPKNQLFPRIILIRAGRYNPKTHNVGDIMCMLYYLIQILMIEDDVATVLGTKILVDYEGVTISHLIQATPSMLKKMVAVCQDSMPLRVKGSHHIKLPSKIEIIFTLIRGFLNKKAKERLKIHKTCEDLGEFIPEEIIPNEYGGAGDSVEVTVEYWVSKFKEYKSWMKEEEKFGTDESKLTAHPIKRDSMGTGSSFRKLQID